MQRLKSCAAAWVIESFYTTYTYIKVKSYIPSSAFSHKKVGKRGKYEKDSNGWLLGALAPSRLEFLALMPRSHQIM